MFAGDMSFDPESLRVLQRVFEKAAAALLPPVRQPAADRHAP
jgi:hypothetical protein